MTEEPWSPRELFAVTVLAVLELGKGSLDVPRAKFLLEPLLKKHDLLLEADLASGPRGARRVAVRWWETTGNAVGELRAWEYMVAGERNFWTRTDHGADSYRSRVKEAGANPRDLNEVMRLGRADLIRIGRLLVPHAQSR